MKKVFGLCIFVIIFLVAAGCTQSAPSTTATTTVPTATVASETVTVMATATPVENATTAATVETTPAADANITQATIAATETTIETTAAEPTLAAVQTPVIKVKEIHILNNTFVPPVTTVLPGTGITWFNDDKIIHTVKTTGTHAGMFNSGDIAPGTQWGYTFGATEWTVTYADPNFPGMNGSIIIQNGRTLTTSYGK